jgi:hypothetical protein
MTGRDDGQVKESVGRGDTPVLKGSGQSQPC